LRARAAPDARVAVSVVGAIGYYSHLTLIDILGMTNEAIAEAPPDLEIKIKGHHRHDANWVMAQKPDLILIGGGRILEGTHTLVLFGWEDDLLVHPDFALYSPMAMPVEGSYPLYFFLRQGSQKPEGAVPAEVNPRAPVQPAGLHPGVQASGAPSGAAPAGHPGKRG
jgi:hypothetical protein